jgi:hypothetical protein
MEVESRFMERTLTADYGDTIQDMENLTQPNYVDWKRVLT